MSIIEEKHNIEHPAAEGGEGSTETNPNQELTPWSCGQASEIAQQRSTRHIHQQMAIGPMERHLPTHERSRNSAKRHQD
jgi:hypothetical protein